MRHDATGMCQKKVMGENPGKTCVNMSKDDIVNEKSDKNCFSIDERLNETKKCPEIVNKGIAMG